jgi:acyl-CoA synthetase (NDP forming)
MLLSEPPRIAPPDPSPAFALYSASARRIAESPVPVVVVSNVLTDVTEFGRLVQQETGFPYVVGGIEHGLQAIGAAVRWSETRARALARPPALPRGSRTAPPGATGVWAEHRASALLASAGLPVVPSVLVHEESAAVASADDFGYPVVLKIAAEGLGHKSDIGGVRLGLSGPEEVRAAYRALTSALPPPSGVPVESPSPADATADAPPASGATGGVPSMVGVLVQPQRSGGVELLVGIVRDPAWGLTLAVGLGGVWVEVLRDTALRVLPVDAEEVRLALSELRGAALLRGARGGEPADLDAVAEVVARIAAFAETLGDELDSLEINPLLVNGSRVEALDALVTWRT